MKIFLDDDRTTPKNWVRCYWPNEVIDLLEKGGVTHLSLDHDLGHTEITGYDVLLWIEKKVVENIFWKPPTTIIIHTQNPSARDKMRTALLSIKKYCGHPIHCVMAPYNANTFYYTEGN